MRKPLEESVGNGRRCGIFTSIAQYRDYEHCARCLDNRFHRCSTMDTIFCYPFVGLG